jgi:hypothetical protein
MATAGAATGLLGAEVETIAAAAAKRPIVAALHVAVEEHAAVAAQSAAAKSGQAERGPAPDAWQRRAPPQRAQAIQQLPAQARRTHRLRAAAVVAVAEHERVAELAAGMTAAKTRSDLTAAEPGSDFKNLRRSLPAPPLCIFGTTASFRDNSFFVGVHEARLQ